MKTKIEVAQKGVSKTEKYEAPTIEIMEIVLEQGFAGPSGINPNAPNKQRDPGSY
jgi:hypothetical protein